MTDTRYDYDAIVIGGGPSGAAYAMTLVRAGYSALVLEKERFPRFHIGESFIPFTIDVLEDLGVLDKICQSGFVVKKGVELTDTSGAARRVDLELIGEGYRSWTLQVERAHFDEIMLDAAAECGATVVQGAKAQELLFTDSRVSGVRYTHEGQSHVATSRFVVDATGRAGIIARGLQLRTSDNNLKMAAVYKHLGRLDERRNPGVEGDIQLGLHEDGWVWAIPVRPDTISIGTMVPADLLRASRPEELFADHLERIPRITARIEGTEVVRGLHGENNFEYHSDTLAGPGFFIIGDAGCFTDPVFSAGVFLALMTGRRAAEETAACLAGESAEATAAQRYQDFYKTGYESYYRLIRAVYDRRYQVMGRYIQKVMMDNGIEEMWRVRALSGDFWTESNPVIGALRKEADWRLFSSYEPQFGCPLYGPGTARSLTVAGVGGLQAAPVPA